MAQDQLFKDLLRTFFREFLELFFPEVAARLDFARVTFLDKEAFTDLPEGSRREADLVAQTYTAEGQPEIILVHVEVQTQRRGEFPYRMWEYYSLLRLRHKLPVFPVVVYLAPGATSRERDGGGLVEETYTEALLGKGILTFVYQAVGLPDLAADDYLERENPLGPALSALMRPGGTGRVLRRIMAMQKKAIIQTDEARRALLLNVIETYLPLSTEEEEEFRRLLGQPEFVEVRQMITVYEERATLQTLRRTLSKLLRARFGELPERVVTRIEAMNNEAELDALLERVLTAASLEEMGLNDVS